MHAQPRGQAAIDITVCAAAMLSRPLLIPQSTHHAYADSRGSIMSGWYDAVLQFH